MKEDIARSVWNANRMWICAIAVESALTALWIREITVLSVQSVLGNFAQMVVTTVLTAAQRMIGFVSSADVALKLWESTSAYHADCVRIAVTKTLKMADARMAIYV